MSQIRVLVVDDDPWILRMVSSSLEKKGSYAVETARDGQQALAQAQATPPDIVISDLMMPVMDGWAFVQALRALPAIGDTPVLFLTALGKDEDRLRALGLKPEDYMSKPFRFDDLERRLLKILSLRGKVVALPSGPGGYTQTQFRGGGGAGPPAPGPQNYGGPTPRGFGPQQGGPNPYAPAGTPQQPGYPQQQPGYPQQQPGYPQQQPGYPQQQPGYPQQQPAYPQQQPGYPQQQPGAFGQPFEHGAPAPPYPGQAGAQPSPGAPQDPPQREPAPPAPAAEAPDPADSFTRHQRRTGLTGRLEQLGLSSLLVMMEMERKDGVLQLQWAENKLVGRIFLRKGQVIQSRIEKDPTPRNGRESVYHMLTWTKGRFHFTAMDVEMEDQVETSTTSLLMEGARLIDEANR